MQRSKMPHSVTPAPMLTLSPSLFMGHPSTSFQLTRNTSFVYVKVCMVRNVFSYKTYTFKVKWYCDLNVWTDLFVNLNPTSKMRRHLTDFECLKNVRSSTNFECGFEVRHIPTLDNRCLLYDIIAGGSVSNVWGSKVTGQCIHQQLPRLLQLSAVRHNRHPVPASTVSAKCGGEAGKWYTRQRAHYTAVEVTPLVANLPAYHVQGHHHCPQISKQPCSNVPVQWLTVRWSSSDRHALCQRSPTGSSRLRTAIGDWLFRIAGPRVWNTLPASVRDTNSSLRFMKLLKAFLFVWWPQRRWHWTGTLKWTHLT